MSVLLNHFYFSALFSFRKFGQFSFVLVDAVLGGRIYLRQPGSFERVTVTASMLVEDVRFVHD